MVVSGRACLDVDDDATVRAADPALQEQGPPYFRSVVLTCGPAPYLDDGSVSIESIRAFFEAAEANNDPVFRSSLSGGFVNGANENGVIAFPAAQLGSYFQPVAYIGAVRDIDDLWYRGWTCDSAAASFGSGRKCSDAP